MSCVRIEPDAGRPRQDRESAVPIYKYAYHVVSTYITNNQQRVYCVRPTNIETVVLRNSKSKKE